ncbi:20114_t:CDS:1, partial [Racocetra fulgida]
MPRNRSFNQILDSITDSESVGSNIAETSMLTQRNTHIPCHCLSYTYNGNLVSRRTKAQNELEDMIQQEGEEKSESFTEQLGRLNL